MAKTPTVPVPGVPSVATTVVAGVARENPLLTAVRTDVAMPERSGKRGSKSSYDFSVLSVVGASFGVTNKTKVQVNAIVGRVNKAHCTQTPDPMLPGKVIKTYSARFEAFDVDPKTDPDGAKVRVFRVE